MGLHKVFADCARCQSWMDDLIYKREATMDASAVDFPWVRYNLLIAKRE